MFAGFELDQSEKGTSEVFFASDEAVGISIVD